MTKNAQWRQAILDEASIALADGAAAEFPGCPAAPRGAEGNVQFAQPWISY